MVRPSWRSRITPALLVAALAAFALAAGGCGDEEEPAVHAPGPAPPGGDVIASSATIYDDDPFTNLATATVDVRGESRVLIVGLVELERRQPKLRITVDGDPVRGAQTRVFDGPEGKLAAIFCNCESGGDVRLQARSNRKARVGVHSLTAFTAGTPAEPGLHLDGATIVDEPVELDPAGSRIASMRLREDAESLLAIATLRSAGASSASPNPVRTEARLAGASIPEIASASIPHGELAVFYAPAGGSAGDRLELNGFLAAGQTSVRAATLAVCPCGLGER